MSVISTSYFTFKSGSTDTPPAYYYCSDEASLPSALDGDIAFVDDTHKIYIYNGAGWFPLVIEHSGTWTPTLIGTGGQSGQVYATQSGRFVKKGREVWAYGNLTLTTRGTITGNAQIGGLPFTSYSNAARGSCHFGYVTGMGVNISSFMGYIPGAGTAIQLVYFPAAGAAAVTVATQATFVTGTIDLIFSAHYETDD